jgi:AraC family transcriptional regulator
VRPRYTVAMPEEREARESRSRRPLCDIAVDCGFYDQTHLGRLLKRELGLTPGEVRAAAAP